MTSAPALMQNYGSLFGEILSSAPQLSRDESYREKINSISRQLGSLVNEVFSRFPTIIDDAGRLSAWNELVDKSRELMLYYINFYKENPNAPPPTKDTMLTELRVKVSDLGLKSAIDTLRGVGGRTAFQGPQLAQPRALENVPAREAEAPAQAPAARPVVRTAATINELQSAGYTNILDTNIAGKIFRFASNDPSLDVVGMDPEQLLQYAIDHPEKMRMFEVNSRGYATRELHSSSERDLNRVRTQLEARRREMES